MNRRTFLKLSAAGLSTAALARFPWGLAQGSAQNLIVVSNAGDGTVSLIDPHGLEVLKTLPLAGAYSFPATRWDFERDLVWSGLPAGPNNAVLAYRLSTGERVLELPTGSSQNYTELTPDGRHLIVAARFVDTFLKISADPDASDFGEVVARIETYAGASPCDITVSADGRYAYAPDRGGDTLTTLRLDPFERVSVTPLENKTDAPLEPYMGTVSPAGGHLLIENAPVEGGPDAGSESVFDLEDPAQPVEVVRLSQKDGLGRGPINSAVTQDGRYALVICRDSSEVSVIDLEGSKVMTNVALPSGSNPLMGTFVYGGDADTLFVPLPGRDAVAAISIPGFGVTLIPVGPRPLGAVYLRAPLPERAAVLRPVGAALAAGRIFAADCPDRCCGAL